MVWPCPMRRGSAILTRSAQVSFPTAVAGLYSMCAFISGALSSPSAMILSSTELNVTRTPSYSGMLRSRRTSAIRSVTSSSTPRLPCGAFQASEVRFATTRR